MPKRTMQRMELPVTLATEPLLRLIGGATETEEITAGAGLEEGAGLCARPASDN